MIHELYGHETQTFDYREALTCIRLAPGYAKQNELAVGSFDGHIRLKNKNWFGQMKDEDVHDDECQGARRVSRYTSLRIVIA